MMIHTYDALIITLSVQTAPPRFPRSGPGCPAEADVLPPSSHSVRLQRRSRRQRVYQRCRRHVNQERNRRHVNRRSRRYVNLRNSGQGFLITIHMFKTVKQQFGSLEDKVGPTSHPCLKIPSGAIKSFLTRDLF